MCALAAITVLASLLFLTPWVWIPTRGISGFCFAGAAMIVESWLNERAEATSRGRVFGLYTMVNLASTTLGQLALTTGDTATHLFFVIAAIFYALALCACLRFRRLDLAFWILAVTFIMDMKSQLAWEKYALPVIVALWYLKSIRAIDEGPFPLAKTGPNPTRGSGHARTTETRG